MRRTHTREALDSTSRSRLQTCIRNSRTPVLNSRHLPLAAEGLLCRASEAPIGHLPRTVEMLRQEEFIPFQNRLMSICLERIVKQPARHEQVRVIRQLVSPAAFLEVGCCYRLAHLFELQRKVVWRYFSVEDAKREAPTLRHW